MISPETQDLLGSSPATGTTIDMTRNNHNKVVAAKLPPEIRNRIYKLVLTQSDDDPSTIPSNKLHQVFDAEGPTFKDFSLLFVSRQTYLEAFPVFYRFNKLHFQNTNALYKFLKNIGYARRQQITSIAFGWTFFSCDAKAAFRLLKTCSSLRFVEIIIDSSTYPVWGNWGHAALKEVRGMEKVEIRAHYPWVPSRRREYPDTAPLTGMKEAMMRPRLKQFTANPEEMIDPFKQRREKFKPLEANLLRAEFETGLYTPAGYRPKMYDSEVRRPPTKHYYE